jgi:hypothetical protein
MKARYRKAGLERHCLAQEIGLSSPFFPEYVCEIKARRTEGDIQHSLIRHSLGSGPGNGRSW